MLGRLIVVGSECSGVERMGWRVIRDVGEYSAPAGVDGEEGVGIMRDLFRKVAHLLQMEMLLLLHMVVLLRTEGIIMGLLKVVVGKSGGISLVRGVVGRIFFVLALDVGEAVGDDS